MDQTYRQPLTLRPAARLVVLNIPAAGRRPATTMPATDRTPGVTMVERPALAVPEGTKRRPLVLPLVVERT